MSLLQQAAAALTQVHRTKPLVHHITNYVTVNDCANITLAIGASPVMADDPAEVEEMTAVANALVLNMGTLNSRTVGSMLAAGKQARQKGIPIIFDPVGVGATSLRTATAGQIIEELRPTVIRGNMSEIKIIAGLDAAIKGVDSVAGDEAGESVAAELSRKLDCVIAITGKTDIVAGGGRLCRIGNGHPLLAKLTGSGCMATSLTGCFCGANADEFAATVAAIIAMGLAGERAQASLRPGEGIGTFHMRLFDAIATMTPDNLYQGGKVNEA
ncbi:MAG: hydroxyethylthiazole kinase [Sporomusaceae bacterium]|nr:hydroxyethylthiazole kinase [Sporomusaceae bacterium]